MLWSISNKCCHIHLYQQRTGLWNSKEGHYLLRQMSKKWRHTSLWTLGTQKVLLVIFLMHLIQACKMIFFSFPKMLNWKAKKKKTTKNWQKKKKRASVSPRRKVQQSLLLSKCSCFETWFLLQVIWTGKCRGIKILGLLTHVLHLFPKFRNFKEESIVSS